MKIVLMNAAVPDYPWKKKYSPDAYVLAMRDWEQMTIAMDSVPVGNTDGYHIYRASSLHARQTAEQWLGAERAERCEELSLLDEIPLVPYEDAAREIGLWRYYWRWYDQWRRGDPRQPEVYQRSWELGQKLCDLLEERNENVILISHERRILLLLKVFRNRGYQIRRGSMFRVAPLERILAAKDIPTCGGCMHNCQLSNPGCSIGCEKARVRGSGSEVGQRDVYLWPTAVIK